jgi:hypothetical protein
MKRKDVIKIEIKRKKPSGYEGSSNVRLALMSSLPQDQYDFENTIKIAHIVKTS